MGRVFFPDNTVLINFAHLRRLDLLARLAKNGSWCATVADECRRSSYEDDLEELSSVSDIFGDPLYPESRVEHALVLNFRLRLAEPGDPEYRHLGEAETLAIIDSRNIEAVIATDDSGVATIASSGDFTARVLIVTTWQLLRLSCRLGFVDADTLWSYVDLLRSRGRHLPPGRAARERSCFDVWLTED